MDLTTVASDKAAMQAVAEGKSRLSNQFARNLLTGMTTTVDFLVSQLEVAANKDAGDYTLTFTKVTDTRINVKADGVTARGVKGTNSSVWSRPQ
jgi:hypothetical protein